jgi:hypothetical protein
MEVNTCNQYCHKILQINIFIIKLTEGVNIVREIKGTRIFSSQHRLTLDCLYSRFEISIYLLLGDRRWRTAGGWEIRSG